MINQKCVMCGSEYTEWIHREDTRIESVRDYYHCGECDLIFVLPEQRLSAGEEFSRYEMHENDPEDPRYRKFLSRIYNPLVEKLSEQSFGLDFGSGPGPTLNQMLEEEGHFVRIYDPFYSNDPGVFEDQYDFITTTETVEHLYDPLMELDRLWKILKPGGYLGVMTHRWTTVEKFKKWHYINDDTHVIFFHENTFRWLQKRWDAGLEIYERDVVIFEK